jgi:hypothetical protein
MSATLEKEEVADGAELELVDQSNLFQNIAFVFCVLIGLIMIANTQTAGDGVWFWYSSFLHSGQHLYADLHLALQPLYVLETSGFLAMLGKGWLVSKIPAALHLVAYCLALLLLVRQSSLSDARKAILLACSFFVSASAVSYRFDDYHVLADCFVVYSLLALLSLRTSSSSRRTLGLAATLGVLSGLALTTRLNDGAALFVGVFLAIVCLAPSKKLLSLLLFCLSTGLTLLLIVGLTGDSLHDYAQYSIFNSAGAKGGAGSAMAQPLHLPWNTVEWLIHAWPSTMLFYGLVLALIWAFVLGPLTRRPGWRERGLGFLGAIVIAFWAQRTSGVFSGLGLLASVAGLLVLLACGLGIWVAARFILWLSDPRRANAWDRRQILLLLPLGQLASASMSSGGSHIGQYGPLGVLIVLLAICSPIHLKAEWRRDILFAFAVLLLVCTVNYRLNDPYSWHTYTDKPIFYERTWYPHPDYGPMIIDRDLLQMIDPVCQKIRDSGSDNELLSLPLPYANYFCSIPPWHGYVQTFFDTTSKQTIGGLMDELEDSPPKWIFYQRQLWTLRLHEIVYNHGSPLQHRLLDQLIEYKIGNGIWRVVYTNDYDKVTLHSRGYSRQWDNEWILIQTR